MGYVLGTSVGDIGDVVALIGPDAAGKDRARVRARARALDEEHPEQAGSGPTVAAALEDILAGRDLDPAAGGAYARAFHVMAGASFREGPSLGPFPRPAALFGRLDEELERLGVARELRPVAFVFGGLPAGGFALPDHADPVLGWLDLVHAAPLAEAYEKVDDQLEEGFRDVARELVAVARHALRAAERRPARGRGRPTGILTHLA
ncbi:hypothetical protein ABT160_21480 [Streptomyces sp. NPDC001941]|uniref:DUF7691 family protein n=1 Tax=Streptomyces sp. NPDC001941 TaxID=3154659 RepID=UPI003326EE8F